MSSFLSKDVPLGWSMHVASIKALTEVSHRVNEHFIWINEVIAEAKKTLTTDDVELLPKTPSSKKTRRRVNSRTSGGNSDVPKRATRSSKRLSDQNSVDLSVNGKLPVTKKASYDLDAIDEKEENVNAVKGARVRIAEDDGKRNGAKGKERLAENQPSKCLFKQLEEATNKLDERELNASARDSNISKVIAVNEPVAREGTRKRKKAADAKKDPTKLDISDKEITSENESMKDDKLFEETEAIGSKYKRPKTSIKNTSTRLKAKKCDVQHETESKLVPENEWVSNDACSEISPALKNEETMEHTESILEENYTIGIIPKFLHKIVEITNLTEEMRCEYVDEKNETCKAVDEKDGLSETQKECMTEVTETVGIIADNGEEGTVPVDSGKIEDMLVDTISEDENHKGSMSEDSLECLQELELDLVKTVVQPPISILVSSNSVQNSRTSLCSVLAECESLLVSGVAKPEQIVVEYVTVGLSSDEVPTVTASECMALEISRDKKLEAVSTESHTPSIAEDREAVKTAAGKTEERSPVCCQSQLNVISDKNTSSLDDSKIVASNSNSVIDICSSRNERLLPFSSERSKHSSSKISMAVSSTDSSIDSQEVVFKASSLSGKSSGDLQTVVASTMASSCSYSSENSFTAVSAVISSGTCSGNSPMVAPTEVLSTGALSGNKSVAHDSVALSSIRDSPKVIPAACSSFMSWEPISSVSDKVVTMATVGNFSPSRSQPYLLADQAETKATELTPTDFLKKTPWSASPDSVNPTSMAGVSPSRIYLKVQQKNFPVDVDNSEMPTNQKMPRTVDSPAQVDLNFKSAFEDALVVLRCSPEYPSPLGNVHSSADDHLMDPLTANVPELDPVNNTRNDAKFFPTLGSPKTAEHELNHQSDCKDTSSPLKRFYSKMKVKLGSFLGSQGQSKSSLSSAPRSPGSLSMASSVSRSFKVISDSPSKQEDTHTASSSLDKFCIASIEDMEVEVTNGQGSSPDSHTCAPCSNSPVRVKGANTKRLSKCRKSHSRRQSSVHARLSISHRRSSGPHRSRLSKRLMSALKRKMSRTPAVSTSIKENVLIQNDASLTHGLPFGSTQSDMRLPVDEAACDAAQEEEACCSAPFHPKDYEDAISDDDAVCDTPPVALTKTKGQLEQVPCGSLRQKMDLGEESIVNQGSVGTPVSSACQRMQAPSTLKPKRPLGSRIKMLQEIICQSPAFSSKTKKKNSNSSVTSNTSSVTSGVKTKKLGIWSTSQRRISLKRTKKVQKSKTASQWTDLNESTSSNTGGASSSSVFTSSGSATKTPVHPASFLNMLSKKPSSSSVASSGSVKSFITHNTPVKITREEQDEQKRKELEVKKKKLEEAEQRKQEQRLRKAEELKRQREERQMLAQKRREERLQKDLEQKREMMLKLEETSKASSRAAEERLREEREKQKLRERRIAEAEQRRKQEEDARQQMALRMEREREVFEEQQRLRRELEDQERQQKLNEQRRQEEERRKQLERERLAEQERQRVMEEQKLKEEQEKQQQKEDREKRDRAERDRLEVERQRERERQKDINIEKQRDAERQRLLLKQAEGEESNPKDRPFAKVIEKHNQNLKCNASMMSNTVLGIIQSAAKTTSATACTSAARVPVTSASAVKTAPLTNSIYLAPAPPLTKPAVKGFNSTAATDKGTVSASIVAEHDTDSYDMTPAQKIKKPSTEENYDIADLHSDDSTDDESKPRKKIPLWAQGTHLKALLIAQFTHPPDVEKIFGPVYALDLNDVFKKKKPRFNKRTSSAVWDEPLMPKPASLKF